MSEVTPKVGPLKWDETGKRYFEAGVSNVALYVQVPGKNGAAATYKPGVAWNGVISISESPEGADANDLWADNRKYATLRSLETYSASIEAYTYPEEFNECDGFETPEGANGVYLGQQNRTAFGLAYKTNVGSDVDASLGAYKLHIIFNATVSPSDRQYETINDSADAITFSWDMTATSTPVTGFKDVCTITIDSRTANAENLKTLEEKLFGKDGVAPEFQTPDQVLQIMGYSKASA